MAKQSTIQKKEKTKSPLFEVIGLINSKDHYPDEDEIKNYSPYIGNYQFSLFKETIFVAQKMNVLWAIPKEANFSFYFYGLEKRNRFSKWEKKNKEEEEKINLLKELFDYSSLRARETIPLIDSLNLWEDIKKELNKGGSHS